MWRERGEFVSLCVGCVWGGGCRKGRGWLEREELSVRACALITRPPARPSPHTLFVCPPISLSVCLAPSPTLPPATTTRGSTALPSDLLILAPLAPHYLSLYSSPIIYLSRPTLPPSMTTRGSTTLPSDLLILAPRSSSTNPCVSTCAWHVVHVCHVWFCV